MKETILTITLNPAIDKTVRVDNFKIGKDYREKALSLSAGGKGINVSRVLNKLKVKNIASGFIGGSNGSFIKDQLAKEKIRYSFFQIKENTRMSLTVLDGKSKTITRVLERGPEVSPTELKSFRKLFTSLLKKSTYVIFSGRNIPGAQDTIYRQLIELAKRNRVRSILDTSGPALLKGIRKKFFMLKPNLAEAEQILNIKINSLAKVKQALYGLHNLGIEVLALTMGSKGAVAYDGKEMVVARVPKVKAVSPVGCGDAFIAGFIASFSRSKNLGQSLKAGACAGTTNALNITPGHINISDLRRISKKIKIKNI